MLKNSLFSVLLIIILLSGCSKGRLNTDPATDHLSGPLKKAELYYLKGKSLLDEGNKDAASYYFDRSLNLLLESSSSGSVNKRIVEEYIKKISSLELNHLKYINDISTEKEKALIDEVINTRLFKPSQKDILKIRELAVKSEPTFSIPVEINDKVVAFIKAFQSVRHKSIQNALDRSGIYLDRFKTIFRDTGVPEDLAYLPIIESGFRTNAYSRARAMGIWQFIRSTARLYGLRVDWILDERKDPEKSAKAAAKYLKHLHEKFGDWYLALASYNGGPGKVSRAIRRVGSRDFYRLARTRYLRRETRNYVPAFVASLLIAKSPEKYGFKINDPETLYRESRIVEIISPVSLKSVSLLLGLPYSKMKELNPEIVRDFTPFNKKTYLIRIPSSSDETSLEELKRLPPKSRYFSGWYRVKKGDSLYSIARKFRTSVTKIKKVNKLRSNLIRPGKRLLIPR
ncbi:MAG: transglycosylase SLT domain-containing protein [Candidatus Aminicenantes bacterium]|nr:transglycosylase SLT domain-containing protein [Candidatus Aminicenantes bacterium]